jgi:1-acyl-sn-glycerol-3-phosphate acyltransferase
VTALFRIVAMILWLLALLPLHGVWRLFRRPSPWPRAFLGGIARIAGARVTVRGKLLPAPVLYLANHQSWLDIMVLAGASGAAFVSKDDVARWPLFGWLASLNNTVFIARSDRNGVRQQADALASALLGPQPVALFPEGTTTDGAALLPFNASLLGAVSPPPAGVRIQPVAIDYGKSRADVAWFGDETATANVMRLLRRRGGFGVTLRFLPAMEAPSDRKRIAREARSAIDEALYGGASAETGRPFGSTRSSL